LSSISRFEDEDDDEDERLALPRLLRARTDHRQFKERRFARGRAAASRRAAGQWRGEGFRIQSGLRAMLGFFEVLNVWFFPRGPLSSPVLVSRWTIAGDENG
jgi:hypothetical protein